MDSRPSLAANSPLRASKTFAVDDQAKGVLQTVNQVTRQLRHARQLRRQKSARLDGFKKQLIDETLAQTEDAVQQVAALAEGARFDMQVNGGKVDARLPYILRDSPDIHPSLTRLDIVSRSLDMVLYMLTSRDPSSREDDRSSPEPASVSNSRPPPTCEDGTFTPHSRLKNIRRRASVQSLDDDTPPPAPTTARPRSMSSLFDILPRTLPPEISRHEVVHSKTTMQQLHPPQVRFTFVVEPDNDPDELDVLLFQQATCFTPPLTEKTHFSTQADYFPTVTLSDYETSSCTHTEHTTPTSHSLHIEAADYKSPTEFLSSYRYASPMWNGQARQQESELCMEDLNAELKLASSAVPAPLRPKRKMARYYQAWYQSEIC